jgi:hypothetical protein
MGKISRIEVPVSEETAAALADPRRLEAIGRLLDRLVRPGEDDPLIVLLERTTAQAQAAGLTPEEVDAELALYNSERRN